MSERTYKSHRSIEGIVSLFTNFKNQKTREAEQLKSALYNVGLLVLLGAFALVILILLPFIRPLAFGVLFGAVLFPAKKKLSNSINRWIDKIEKNDVPVIIGIASIPFNALEKLGEVIILFIFTHIKIILGGTGSIILLKILHSILPKKLLSYVVDIVLWQHSLFEYIVSTFNTLLLLLIIISFVISLYLLWNSTTSSFFTIAGQFIWIVIIAYGCSFFGPFQIPVFVTIMIYAFLAMMYDETTYNQLVARFKNIFRKEANIIQQLEQEEKGDDEEEVQATSTAPLVASNELLQKTKSHLSEMKSKLQLNVPQSDQKSSKKDEEELESNWYFQILFYACAATILFKHLWIVTFCIIPVIFYSIIAICKALGLWNYVEAKLKDPINNIKEWANQRRYALMPIFLPGMIQLNKKVHSMFCTIMKSYVDDISACVMIIFLILSVIFISVFSFAQIYSEAITVVQLTGDLVNRTLAVRPELVDMLPINMQSMNDVIDNAYQYSRTTIEEHLDSFLNNTDKEQAIKFKTQILSLWDRLIQRYMDQYNGNEVGPRVTSESVFDTIDEIFTSSGLTFTSIFAWAKNNLSLMKEIGDSVWIVLRTNLTLLFSIITTSFGVLISSGHFMLTILFNSVIFFTTLYYLLQSSKDRYTPIAVNSNSAIQLRILEALESSVSSVLIATLKLSIFHGLFTFVTHSIFGAHVVYLPAFLAAILAAAPFLETYWCSIPAFLDLWLTQNHFYLGVALVLIHFIVPPNFNIIIHSEIKGSGHPYLTALSIAGGIYLLGLEGAIIGPLLLCLLIVLFEFTISLTSSSPLNTFTQQTSNEESASPILLPPK
ncbi:transmembrane protein 245 isoform X3 [Chironomus tepperi]|uniref:transmembrane protein 245 isoform X3 n=1 Tax=Chironomus tepperi TaxID=113505 RepID=UPI00391FA3A0